MRLFSFLQRLRVLLALPLVAGAGNLYGQTYITSFSEAEWNTKSGPFSCELSHAISGFGSIHLIRKTAVGETLEIKASKRHFDAGPLGISAVPPSWRSEAAHRDLGQVTASSVSLIIKAPQIAGITSSLKQGSNVIFTSPNLQVGVEARKFGDAFASYERCVKNLIPYTFNQLARTQLNYGAKDEELKSSSKTHLDKIARYMKADKNVLGIIVDAHADSQTSPEESESLSKRQAELVASYLGDKGIPDGLITARWHGDKFPIASNQTKAGQDKNRRITLRLENAESRKELEKKLAAKKAAEQKTQNQQNAGVAPDVTQKEDPKSPAAITAAELEKLVEEQNFFTPVKKPDAVRPK